MEDRDIIKALECCKKAKLNQDCLDLKCPFSTKYGCNIDSEDLRNEALDLINRQKAEFDKLAEEYGELIIEKDELFDIAEKQKAEIERLAKLTELDDKHIKNLEKAFNDRTAELQDAKFDNKQLRKDVERLDKRRINDCRHWQEKYNSLRTEAVKEFAERLKEKQQTFIGHDYTCNFIYLNKIDNLVKEMVGES